HPPMVRLLTKALLYGRARGAPTATSPELCGGELTGRPVRCGVTVRPWMLEVEDEVVGVLSDEAVPDLMRLLDTHAFREQFVHTTVLPAPCEQAPGPPSIGLANVSR